MVERARAGDMVGDGWEMGVRGRQELEINPCGGGANSGKQRTNEDMAWSDMRKLLLVGRPIGWHISCRNVLSCFETL